MQLNKSNGTENVFWRIGNSGICAMHMKWGKLSGAGVDCYLKFFLEVTICSIKLFHNYLNGMISNKSLYINKYIYCTHESRSVMPFQTVFVPLTKFWFLSQHFRQTLFTYNILFLGIIAPCSSQTITIKIQSVKPRWKWLFYISWQLFW